MLPLGGGRHWEKIVACRLGEDVLPLGRFSRFLIIGGWGIRDEAVKKTCLRERGEVKRAG